MDNLCTQGQGGMDVSAEVLYRRALAALTHVCRARAHTLTRFVMRWHIGYSVHSFLEMEVSNRTSLANRPDQKS